MTDSNTLPGARARLVNPDGTTRREFYDFFRRLESQTPAETTPVVPAEPIITGATSPLGIVGGNVTLQFLTSGLGGSLLGVTVDGYGRVTAVRPVVAGAGVVIDETTSEDEISIRTTSMRITTDGDFRRTTQNDLREAD